MIALTQFSFSLSFVSYITASAKSILGGEIWIWYICFCLWLILIPIAWVRNISKFSFTFLIGNLCIITTVIVVSAYLYVDFRRDGFGPGIEPMNYKSYWSMVGFSVYTYEGIGVVMPIMSNCACPEKFDKILFYALMTLTLIYCFFANFCYLVLGSNIDRSFITQELDQSLIVVKVLMVIYSLNLICSYAIFIYPCN